MRASVVVGADGTESATAAVRWAATEADRRRLPLRIVHVLDWDWSVSRYDYQGECLDSARRCAESIIREAAGRAAELAPAVAIELLVPVGRPVTALVRMSRTAALMVVGSRRHSGWARLQPGSVSRRVAARAHCPVAVIRGRTGRRGDPVAAGVNDSDHAESVLEVAFRSAHERGANLVVVRSYRPGQVPGTAAGTAERDALVRDRLVARIAPWRARFPHVPVDTLVSTDSAATVLTEVSHGTQLVIVGSHGHGLFTGACLGSTGARLLHDASCPVLVAREPEARKDDHESTYR